MLLLAPAGRAALAACLAIVILPAGCQRVPAASSAPAGRASSEPVPVQTVVVERRNLPRVVRVSGTLFGDDETTVASKVSGRVVDVRHDLGDEVAPGETLLRIDPTDVLLGRDERQSAVRKTLAQLGLEAFPSEGFDLDKLPKVEAARLQAENAKARFERGRNLAERTPPLISEQDFADLRTAADVAESGLRTARLDAQATLAEARTLEAQVRIAEQRLADTEVPAPQGVAGADGERRYLVAHRLVSVGDFVQVGQALVRLIDPDPIKLRVKVVERRVAQVKTGQRVEVRVDAYPETFTGQVARVSPAIDDATRTFPVEIRVPNGERRLKPGGFAMAAIEVGASEAELVPADAIVTFAGMHKILLVKNGAVQELRVELGDRAADLVEITTPLPPDAVIVAHPTGALVQGTPVRVDAAEAAK